MKLKDKFDNPIMRHDLGRNELEETREQCAEIAEEFAIGFAEWMAKEYWLNSSGKYTQGQTHKELLEIYKKTL